MASGKVSEAEAFYRFLGHEIDNGGKSKTPEALLSDWRKQHDIETTVAAVQEGYADGEAGRMVRLRELLADADAEEGEG